MPLRSTSTSGAAIRAFITLMSVCPPASARPFGFAASSESASSTDRGRMYSTLARSIAVLYSVRVHRRKENRRHDGEPYTAEGRRRPPPCSAVRYEQVPEPIRRGPPL